MTPATVKSGLSANSMAWVEGGREALESAWTKDESSRTTSICFCSPKDNTTKGVARLLRPDFSALSQYLPVPGAENMNTPAALVFVSRLVKTPSRASLTSAS
jgi:hypothetical protein